jgi:dihydroflavonol-4-reductase
MSCGKLTSTNGTMSCCSQRNDVLPVLTYIRSKADSEAVARKLQETGAPVVIVQPGAVLGPHDPHLSEQMRVLRDTLRGLYPVWPRGGFHQVDVRDVAQLHAAVMESGLGPRRYLVPGRFLDGRTMFVALRTLTGRRLPNVTLPAWMTLPVSWIAAQLQRVTPFHIPLEYEGALVASYATRYDDSRAREELGIQPRPLEETLRDAIGWLHQTGRITARQASQAAATTASTGGE